MSNGGPHGDKWNQFNGPLSDADLLELLNAEFDGKYATAAVVNPSTGNWFIAYYGED